MLACAGAARARGGVCLCACGYVRGGGWGCTQAMSADDEFIYSTEQLRGRVFRDCTKLVRVRVRVRVRIHHCMYTCRCLLTRSICIISVRVSTTYGCLLTRSMRASVVRRCKCISCKCLSVSDASVYHVSEYVYMM